MQAICCDSAFSAYAEPQHYYAKPDVNFFGALKNKKQPIAFYDSVCGIPLFHIPKHRTLEDFEAETTEHGWPSFRPDGKLSFSLWYMLAVYITFDVNPIGCAIVVYDVLYVRVRVGVSNSVSGM